MFRSLKFYWQLNLAVVLGVIVTTAVITGALLVGDSIRGSLRDLTLSRLGEVDWILQAPGFVRDSLAGDLQRDDGAQQSFSRIAAILRMSVPISNPDTGRRASRVSLYGVADSFDGFFDSSLVFDRLPEQVFPSILINETLAAELGAGVGDQLLVRTERYSDVHRESLLGRRSTDEQIETLRLQVNRILPDHGVGRFELTASQAATPVAYIQKSLLQRRLGSEGKTNCLLFAERPDQKPEANVLKRSIAAHLALEDFNLKLVGGESAVSLQSLNFVLLPRHVEVAEEVALELGIGSQRVVTYLANQVRSVSGMTPYSTVSAVEPVQDSLQGLFRLDGSEAPPVPEGAVYVNEWLARDLSLSEGDSVSLSYFVLGEANRLDTESESFQVAGVVAMRGHGADLTLTPEFPGINDRQDISSWDPPFPVDLELVRQKDEDYWDEFGATPKAFVSMTDAVRMWKSPFGVVTSLRLTDSKGVGLRAGSRLSAEFAEKLRQTLGETLSGFRLDPVKQNGLKAASSPTDFTGLFFGFSFFLIASAALVAGALFRLSVELRSREVGLLLSVGYTPGRVRRRLLGEGLMLGLTGVVLGLPCGLGYAALLLVALQSWWRPAVGTSDLVLHARPVSFLLAGAIGIFVVAVFSWISAGALVRRSTPSLLAGRTATVRRKPRGWSRWLPYGALIFAVLLSLFSVWRGSAGAASAQESSILFFLTGVLLLVGAVSLFRNWCYRRSATRNPTSGGLTGMTVRNSSANPGRSVLNVALVSSATFVIVAVGAFRPSGTTDVVDKNSGTGGFVLQATAEVPLLVDPGSQENLEELGFNADEASLVASTRIFSFRVLPGDDTSCLNLYRPMRPRILGVPPGFINRGGFGLRRTMERSEQPWTILRRGLDGDAIPAIGDFESAQWILQKKLGEGVQVEDDLGAPLQLRLEGLLENTIFQSELLISEENFVQHFPRRAGYSFFLIEVDPAVASQLTTVMEEGLRDYGFDVSSTSDRLQKYQAVRTTYISTFQSLGAIGLLLGTVGLGVVLVRNVLERRKELAVLMTFGYRRRTLYAMVLLESCLLLLLGLLLGTVSAFVAVVPGLASASMPLPWLSLLATIGAVFLTGVAASLGALALTTRFPLLPSLKAE